MRKSVVHGKESEMEIQKLKIGEVVKGTIHRITDFGVFVSIDNTTLIGLSRKPMAASNETHDLKDIYSVGGRVRAKILGITGHKISLGLKNSYFEDEKQNEDDSESEEDQEENDLGLVDDGESDEDIQQLIRDAALQFESDDSEGEEDDHVVESADEFEVDESDEGLPVKKQKITDEPSSTVSTTPKNPTIEKIFPNNENSMSLNANPFAPQANTLFWGPSFQPAALTEAANESGDEEESSNESGSDNEDKGGKRKRNRNSAALKAEEEIRRKEVFEIFSNYLIRIRML